MRRKPNLFERRLALAERALRLGDIDGCARLVRLAEAELAIPQNVVWLVQRLNLSKDALDEIEDAVHEYMSVKVGDREEKEDIVTDVFESLKDAYPAITKMQVRTLIRQFCELRISPRYC